MKQYFAQFETDKIIESYFPFGYVGKCIEVGAIDGIIMSNTYRFELDGWECLCIEPQHGKYYYEDLVVNRKLALPYAISSRTGTAKFNVVYFDNQASSAISGLSIDPRLLTDHIKHFNIEVEETIVETKTLAWCIENYFNHPTIDFISIDVEGTELDVLMSFDVNRYNTKLYVIENNYSDPNIEEYMRSKGYIKHRRVEVNDFYIKNKENFNE